MENGHILVYIYTGVALLTIARYVQILYSTWQGSVTEIGQYIGIPAGSRGPSFIWTHSFTISYITDDGITGKYGCSKGKYYAIYAKMRVGDRLSKIRWEWYPVMVQSTAGSLRRDKKHQKS